ncbi:class II glutamine amidotransferase [Salinibacterium sp. SYSU T00001]|uniref:class II glutamine amidotransferase n=1 Tax=Homoserinimonas sedimenticola TaxID=2986805 RepID=UPI002235F142|nr:class II glutamine amidotransferase [Salinibacterium sedimenticola]MCW4385545.1 class II glutamine amidotransferase [Salinibacterium sedimenticola]
MCRLLGLVSRDETTIPGALGGDFDSFTALSAGLHGDGWGVAGELRGLRTLTRAADAAHASVDYRKAASAPVTSGIVHLRAATLDLAVAERNTHPFVHGELSFAHNGSIREIATIEPLIDADLRGSIRGDTDSERYMLALVSELRRSSPVEAARTVAARLGEVAVEASINALLLTPDELIVVADEHAKAPNFLGSDYYALSYLERDGLFAVASSGWEREGWTPVPERSVLTVDRRTLELRIHDLDTARLAIAA